MEDFAEYLVLQARSESAALHEFMLRFDDDSDDLHLFFEGDEDPSFYLPAIRSHAPGITVWNYVCGGKKPLVSLRNYLVVKKYFLNRVLFFVDRDFDDLFNTQIDPHPRTFITEPYSIENYLVGLLQAEIVLTELSGLSRADRDCEAFLDSLDELLRKCALVVRPFLAMALAAREAGIKANFNNINLANAFAVSLDPTLIRRKTGAAAICSVSTFPKGSVVPLGGIVKWNKRLRSMDAKLWFRGKYELWFFEKILLLFLDGLAAKRKNAKQKAVRIPASLREGRLFEALGGRLGSLRSLDIFLGAHV